jgi:serine protease Do
VAGCATLGCLFGAEAACVPRTAVPPSATELTEAARAATVLVQGDFDTTTSIPDVDPVQSQFDALVARIQQLARTGQIRTQAAADAFYQNEILSHPADYLKAGSSRASDHFTFETTGSGFFISSDGYLVTAAHVAAPSKDDIHQLILDSIDADFTKTLTDGVRQDLISNGFTPTEAQLQVMGAWVTDYFRSNVRVDDVEGRLRVATGLSIAPGDAVASHGMVATSVVAGQAAPGKDVAILHVFGRNLPALGLGDEGKLRTSSRLLELGYPCQGCGLHKVAQTGPGRLDLTITSGVPAGEEQNQGWTALGTTAAGTHGDSGGPVVGPDGSVVGIVSYGHSGSTNSFLVPASVVREFVAQAGVRASPGAVTTVYREALADFQLKRYRWALPLFQQVASLDPQQPYVAGFITATEAAIKRGEDRSPPDLSPYVLPVTSLLLLLFPGALSVGTIAYGGRRSARNETR